MGELVRFSAFSVDDGHVDRVIDPRRTNVVYVVVDFQFLSLYERNCFHELVGYVPDFGLSRQLVDRGVVLKRSNRPNGKGNNAGNGLRVIPPMMYGLSGREVLPLRHFDSGN